MPVHRRLSICHLPFARAAAIEAFEQGKFIEPGFDPVLRNALVSCKQQERSGFSAQVTDIEYHSYLETV